MRTRLSSRLAESAARLLTRLGASPAPELAVLAAGAWLYAFNALAYALPTGYAGLYTLMAETLAHNGFALPHTVDFYGPGGVPFAYPPLAVYVAALGIDRLGVPTWVYLRFAPVGFGILSLAAAYVLIRRITGSRSKALVGTFLVTVSGEVFASQIPASGIVRAPASVFALLALGFWWEATRSAARPFRPAVLAGLLLGLTVLTHLSYAAFAILSGVIFTLSAPPHARRSSARSLLVVALAGAVVSAPWWATVWSRHGAGVFQSAMATHGTLGVFRFLPDQPFQAAAAAVRAALSLGRAWMPAALVGMVLLGLAAQLARRRWLVPVWFTATLLGLGEADRYLMLVGSVAAADALIDNLIPPSTQTSAPPPRALGTAALLIVLAFCTYQGYRMVRSVTPVLTSEAIETATWLREHSPSDGVYALISGANDLAEWFPYLAHRTPAISPWGSEWTGQYPQQTSLFEQMDACTARASWDCVDQVLQASGQNPNYLMVPRGLDGAASAAVQNGMWHEVFRNDGYSILAYSDTAP